MAGDLDDVEILYNAGPNALHVAQNLRGDFVFAQNQARVCLFGQQNPDELPAIVKEAISDKTKPRRVSVLVEPCNPEQLSSYDIVATQRNAFLRSKKDALAGSSLKGVGKSEFGGGLAVAQGGSR